VSSAAGARAGASKGGGVNADRAGDEEFVAFVARSQYQLLRVAYLVCGDWHRAEDVVQIALAKVYVRWGRIREVPGPWPYARRAVVNAAVDEGRRPWRREQLGHEPGEGTRAAAAVPQGPGMDDEILVALSALPKRQRAVVVLRYVEDLDVEAVATLLGISPGTVKSQAARGLATLREKLTFNQANAGGVK
jgi:RNA polymerase sigma-70 factor (sigma-E family)